jgi:hypothetical protein
MINDDEKINFYKKIGVEDWLQEKGTQVIKFRDRIERRENGVYHSIDAAAIDFNNEAANQYYLYGERKTKQEWDKISNLKLTQRKLDKIIYDK